MKSSVRPLGTPSSSNGEAPGPSSTVPSSTSVNSSDPTCCPAIAAKSDRPFSTDSALSAPASTPRNDIAANWSRITGTFAVGGFTAPSMRAPRSTASPEIAPTSNSSIARVMRYENPVCVSSPSTASVTTTAQASVRAYSASTPAVEAIATRETASPTCARSIFVTRGSLEIVRRSSSSASSTFRSVGTSALASWNSSGIGVIGSAEGSTLNSSGSASAAFSRARRTASRTSSSEGSAAHA